MGISRMFGSGVERMLVDRSGAVVWSKGEVDGRVGRWEENIPGGGEKSIGSGPSSKAKLMGLDGLDKGCWGK